MLARVVAGLLLTPIYLLAIVPIGTVLPDYGLGDTVSDIGYYYWVNGPPMPGDPDYDPTIVPLNGKVVMVVLTTTYCPGCTGQQSVLNRLYTNSSRSDFEILAAFVDAQTSDAVTNYKLANNLPYPCGLVDSGGIDSAFGYSLRDSVPLHYIVRDGVIVERYWGGGTYAEQESSIRPYLTLSSNWWNPPIQVSLRPPGDIDLFAGSHVHTECSSNPAFCDAHPTCYTRPVFCETNTTNGTVSFPCGTNYCFSSNYVSSRVELTNGNSLYLYRVPTVQIAWPTNWAMTFNIQEASDVNGPWTTRTEQVLSVNGVPFSTNGNYVVLVPRTNTTVFYRLKKMGVP